MKRKKTHQPWAGLLAAGLLALGLAEVARAQPASSNYHQQALQRNHPRTHTSSAGHRFQPLPAAAFSSSPAALDEAGSSLDDRIFRRKQAPAADSETESTDFSPLQNSDDSLSGNLEMAHRQRTSSASLLSDLNSPSALANQQDANLFDSTALGDTSGGQNPAASAYELEGSSGVASVGSQPAGSSVSSASEQTGADESPEPEMAPFASSNSAAMERHNSQLQAMQEMFERRQLGQQRQAGSQNGEQSGENANANGQPELESSQELAPISIGLDPSSPFSMAPFSMGGHGDSGALPAPPGGPRGPMANADEPGLGLSFGLNQLPQLLGFQSPPSAFGPPPPDSGPPQRGDSLPPGPLHLGSSASASGDPDSGPQTGPNGQKVYPKIFRFTDGRINLSDFEKQKKIRLSNKNQLGGGGGGAGDNHIESAPIMFDGRQLKRKSFLILHGGIFSRR